MVKCMLLCLSYPLRYGILTLTGRTQLGIKDVTYRDETYYMFKHGCTTQECI